MALTGEFGISSTHSQAFFDPLEPLDALCLGFLDLAHKIVTLKNKKPTNQCFWRVGLGEPKVGLRLKSQFSYRRVVRGTTCATSAWTTPHLATIRHRNASVPDFPFPVNLKTGRRFGERPHIRRRPLLPPFNFIATR